VEYRNTVRFSEPASSEQLTPSRVEHEHAAQLRGANLLFHDENLALAIEITPWLWDEIAMYSSTWRKFDTPRNSRSHE
jgi:hypothetical protein